MQKKDISLVRKSMKGDKDAFGKLVTEYRGITYGAAYNMVGDFTEAQDLCQEIFIKAYTSLHTLKKPSRFASWLYGITRHVCIDQLRKKKKEISLAGSLPYSRPALDEGAEKRELKQELLEALDGLENKYREIIVLRYQEGFSYGKIAEFLDVPVTTVETRLFRARKMLREKLAPRAKEEGTDD